MNNKLKFLIVNFYATQICSKLGLAALSDYQRHTITAQIMFVDKYSFILNGF